LRRQQVDVVTTTEPKDTVSDEEEKVGDSDRTCSVLLKHDVRTVTPQPSASRHVSFFAGGSDIEVGQTVFSAGGTCVNTPIDGAVQNQQIIFEKVPPTPRPHDLRKPSGSFMAEVLHTLRTLVAPPTLSILIAFPIALVPSLKALFVTMPSSHIPNAPDGKPILFFIYDTASWVGNASVPLSLICLGAALATMKIPRPLTNLPLGSITSLAILKMFITPVVGILIVQGLTYKTNLIHPDDKVLRFVCM
jgi:auxin efflux carrier family protein